MSTFTEAHSVSSTRAPFAVVRVDGHYRVLTTRAIAAGDIVLTLDGIVVDRPSRYSVQIGPTEHIESPGDESVEFALDRRPWRFLNHSCAPSARLDGRDLRALRDLGAWEQVTFDYNTTEFSLAAPFVCRCGAARCCGEVRGFSALDARQRAARAPITARHLLAAPSELPAQDES